MTTTLAVSALCALCVTFVLCLAATAGRLAFLPVAGVNDRSLHRQPVRTSAGLAIVAGLLAAWGIQAAWSGETSLWPVIAGMTVLAATGLADDRHGVPALVRLSVQAAAVVLLLVFPAAGNIPLHPAAIAVLAIAILWFINLFNFMDGSDGLAASQTIVAIFPWLAAIFAGLVAGGSGIETMLAALLSACAAFLVFNRPTARLFMGDAGSLAIPFTVAGLALSSPDPAASGLLVLIGFAPFIADATLTLAIRIATGERWWAAHRSHAYQLAARRTGRHGVPLAALWVYGLVWLTPLALLSASGIVGASAALAAAYLPVIAACVFVQSKWRKALAA